MPEFTFEASITVEATTEGEASDSILEHLMDGVDMPCILYAEGKMKPYVDRIRELKAQLEAVKKDFAECMKTAAEDIADWGEYASPYFQEKHELKTEVQRYKNKADELETAMDDSPKDPRSPGCDRQVQ